MIAGRRTVAYTGASQRGPGGAGRRQRYDNRTGGGGSGGGGGGSQGDATAGKALFTQQGCTGCHTLKAAGASGTVGPNLDQLKPNFDAVVHQVENGGGAMPSFRGSMSEQQIRNVAAFVVASTS